MSLSAYLRAVRDKLDSTFPGLRECELHPGTVNSAELDRIGTKTPSMLVTLGYVEPPEYIHEGYDRAIIPMVYIITGGNADQQLEDAINYVDGITQLIEGEGFGYELAHRASDVAAKNLFTTATGRHATSLWVVRWRQLVRYVEPQAPAEPVPTDLYVGITPEVGAAHEQDYTQVTP
ncbi:hypothetical protein J8L98_02250 [Pseudoalteromonas sp. MMG013]|uniref:hypothetical protein n=1 Tax=Pseudoalteromonas sp. MMG013 TaxID=2822687 RepID=UPI001B38235F|nr:hypothetical protein [Pseudoalteromonas sp. MMG013]MBQ4860514.1 hypothetical protein [Pseudoalteromonas sp. MMG013]